MTEVVDDLGLEVAGTETDDELWEGTEVAPAPALIAAFDALGSVEAKRRLLVEVLGQRDAARLDLLVKWELYQACNGYDFLGEVSRRLDAMNMQLNAAARHERGVRFERNSLPQFAEILLGGWMRLTIPLDVEGNPVTYTEAMRNLVGATATAIVRATANGRWAVNEHQRAERMTALIREVIAWEDGKEHTYDEFPTDLLERLREAV